MKIVWFSDARQQLLDIYHFYAEKDPSVAFSIYSEILASIELLADFPFMGSIEPLLLHLPIQLRYLVAGKGKFKILYEVDSLTVYIYSIWDCRQDPDRLKNKLY